MTAFNFTIDNSQYAEKKLISSIREFLHNQNFQTQNTEYKAGSKRTVNIIGGLNVEKQDIYQDTDNPFDYVRKFPNANILGNYHGQIFVENTKTFQKHVNSEIITFYQYSIKGEINFQPKKLIPGLIFTLGLLIAIGNGFSTGTILFFTLFLIIWAIFVRVFGNSNLGKTKTLILDCFTKYQNIN